jgi:hypothetical protein
MRRIKDDRRPPYRRFDDFERRRRFFVKLGHRPAPFLESAPLKDYQPEDAAFRAAFSVITAALPSEITLNPPMVRFQHSHPVPAGNLPMLESKDHQQI